MDIQARTLLFKQTAAQLGFENCGIAAAKKLDDDARRLESWLKKGYQGNMQYMENHFDLRTDPTLLVPGAKSVVTLLYNYYPEQKQRTDAPKISKYAYGSDYHLVIRQLLNQLLQETRQQLGQFNGRGFVDSAPVLERSWAVRSGLGWVGKNGQLLNKKMGSFFFIATLIIDVELECDLAFGTDHCGDCTRCIDACPTEAILHDKVIDGSRCISYFTIELKEQLIPDKMKGQFQNWMFGCDVCQDVCPWNRFSQPHQKEALSPLSEILSFSFKDWEELTETSFARIFAHSPLKRSKFSGISRNLEFISNNNE